MWVGGLVLVWPPGLVILLSILSSFIRIPLVGRNQVSSELCEYDNEP